MQKKKTTVIIPNYNGMKYLENCLSFLHRSKGTEFDTIVVDNGSTDDSVRFIQYRFAWVKVIALSENTGFSNAVNEGIRAAETPYVLLLNNDTVVEPEFVAELEKAMDRHPDYFSFNAKMLAMSQPDIIDDTGDFYSSLGWAFARGKGQPAERYTTESKVFAACAGAAIYRKSIFEKIGYFDVMHFAYLEDIDLGFRAQIYGYHNGFCPKAIVYHAGSGSSGSRYNEFKVNLSSRNNIYLIAKNFPLFMKVLNLPFFIIGFGIKILFFIKKGFGWIYVRGLFRGLQLAYSKEGRKHKVPFQIKNMGNYASVQMQLWLNIIRKCMK